VAWVKARVGRVTLAVGVGMRGIPVVPLAVLCVYLLGLMG
jgi:hypothetical protein